MRTVPIRPAFNAASRLALCLLLMSGAAQAQYSAWCGNPVPPWGPWAPAPPSQCTACNASGSPTFLATGTYFTSATDLQVPSVGMPLGVSRDYLSTRPVDTGAGVGWSLSFGGRVYYATYLFSAPSTYAKEADVTMPDGRRYRFTENVDGTLTAPTGRYDVLVKNGDGTWSLTLQRTQAVYHYDAVGALQTITDDYGNVQTYSYDANGRVQRVADSAGSGRYVDVYYGADGRVSTVRDSTGREAGYTYNGNGTLATATDLAGHVTTYSYTAGHFGQMLSRITDHWGRIVTEVTYETSGRVKTYTENGELYTYSYKYQNDPAKVSKVDSGGTWVFTTSGAGFVVDRTAPDGTSTHTDYNADGSPQLVIDPAGIKTAYTYDGAGRVLTVTRDYQGSTPVRFDYTYDTNFPNNVAAITPKDPSTGNVNSDWQAWQYDYYAAGSNAPGALHHTYRVQSDGTTLDTLAAYEYDTGGRITRQTSATGGQTDYAYDSLKNLQTVTAPANNDAGTQPVTTYGYDTLGRVTSVTDALSNVTSYTYDALGRVLTVTLPKPSTSSTLTFTTTYSYDNYDSGTGLTFTNITDPNGKLTKLGYDQFGRLVKSIDALNATTTYAYSHGHLDSITDANNNVTSYQYNSAKRLSSTTFPDGAVESYLYWNDGHLKRKTDRKNQAIDYTYDGQKRLTRRTNPGGPYVGYTYTGQKLTSVSDSTVSPNETHSFTYDASYRVASDTQASRGILSYTYDAADRTATQSITGGPNATYAYYPDGSPNTIVWSPIAGQFKYTHKLTGQYQVLTFPNGQTRGYTYDDQGRLTQIANMNGGTTLATFGYGYDYDASNQPTLLGQRTSLTETIPAQNLTGAVTTFGYDGNYQLTGATYPNVAPFNGEVDGWTYDAIGNRTSQTVNGTPTSYTYFKNGSNPLNGQRLQSDGTNTYGYDANGSASSKTGGTNYTFGYTVENRLNSITVGLTASYGYDYQERRSKKTVSGATSTYLFDGQNLVAEAPAGGTTYYLFGASIDEPLAALDPSAAIRYFDVDALGSVVAANDPAGNVTLSTVFDAWGKTRAETGTRLHPFTYSGREVGEAGALFYRARYYDPTLGRFTQEDPGDSGTLTSTSVLRRERNVLPYPSLWFVQLSKETVFPSPVPDPTAHDTSYRYVAGNPIALTDPMGEGWRDWWTGWGVAKLLYCLPPRIRCGSAVNKACACYLGYEENVCLARGNSCCDLMFLRCRFGPLERIIQPRPCVPVLM